MPVRGTGVIATGGPVMGREQSTDTAAAALHTRFGKLPERIRFEDVAEEAEAVPRGGANAYNPEGSWKYYSCLALDLGLQSHPRHIRAPSRPETVRRSSGILTQ